MKILSWNVNGLRAVLQKNFHDWLSTCGGDVIGLQETKLQQGQIPKELDANKNWVSYYSYAEQKGYSGTALFLKKKPDEYTDRLNVETFDREGRMQQIKLGRVILFNVYFPNGKGSERDNSRVPYKMSFYEELWKRIQSLRSQGFEIVVMGDFNTAHHEIDLKNWKSNQKISGFLPEERRVLDAWLDAGFVDTFRYVHGEKEAYSWWSPLAAARERNVGWRIDYVFMTKGLLPKLRDAFILDQVFGSDHCPVGIDIDIEYT